MKKPALKFLLNLLELYCLLYYNNRSEIDMILSSKKGGIDYGICDW